MNPRAFLGDLYRAAVAACAPELCLPKHLPAPPKGRVIVVGAGKAAASMAKAVEDNWVGRLTGLVVTRDGHAMSCRNISVIEAAHPVPDERSLRAAQLILESVKGLNINDLVICLISGGGSSLMTLPAGAVSLQEKQALIRSLLRCGANIAEINCVRKHLSAIKGGHLAAACAPAEVLSLIVSDIPGDDLSLVSSGPTFPDTTTLSDARSVLDKYNIAVPDSVTRHFSSATNETPKKGDSRFSRCRAVSIATNRQALEAAAEIARKSGVTPFILSDNLEGESRELAKQHADIVRQIVFRHRPMPTPCVVLSGGETTVSVTGGGRGGRNTEFLLALAIALENLPGIHAISADTDGIDGTEDNAGSIITPDTLYRAAVMKLDPDIYLSRNDSYSFFSSLGDLFVTGPTRTNVNDFRAILITG